MRTCNEESAIGSNFKEDDRALTLQKLLLQANNVYLSPLPKPCQLRLRRTPPLLPPPPLPPRPNLKRPNCLPNSLVNRAAVKLGWDEIWLLSHINRILDAVASFREENMIPQSLKLNFYTLLILTSKYICVCSNQNKFLSQLLHLFILVL